MSHKGRFPYYKQVNYRRTLRVGDLVEIGVLGGLGVVIKVEKSESGWDPATIQWFNTGDRNTVSSHLESLRVVSRSLHFLDK